MGMSLGQYLVTQGAISSEQLRLALEAQILFGGRLGYNLVDLGFLSTGTLTQHLADYFHVPAADPRQIGHVRPDALRAIPRDMAIRYMALPLTVDRGGVTVAMADPTNFKAIDELAFRTGRSIRVRTLPDFVIKKGLEAHYDVPTFAEFYRPAGVEKLARVRAGVEAGNAHPGGLHEADVDFGALSADEDPYIGFEENLIPAQRAPDAEATLSRRVAAAESRREVDEALLEYARTWFDRVAIFRLHGRVLRGARVHAPAADPSAFRRVTVLLGSGLAERALTEHAILHEPLRASIEDGSLLAALGGGASPNTAVLAPIFPRRGGVTLLYGDNGPGRAALSPEQAGRVQRLERALRKVEVALELVVVRRWLLWS